jgi:hypothetical protein
MSPFPPGGLFGKPLVNVPVDLLYTRRKLLEKIMQNVANRKIQNAIQATGDRMAATPEQFGANLAKGISQMGKKAGVDWRGAIRGAMEGHYGKMLDASVPKAQGMFDRYKQLLTFDRFRRMQQHTSDAMNTLGKVRMPSEEIARVRNQLDDVVQPEFFKSLGTAAGTGVGASLGISAGVNALSGGDKKANSNPADAHGSSFVPLMGGAISGAVKPHPSRGTLTNVLGEGLAGLKGGTIGSLLGGGAGALTDLATKFKGRGVPTLLGTLLGGSLGTHVGSQLHRESIPLNARALAELTNKKSAAEKTAIIDGALIGGALGGASAPEGNVLRGVGRGMVRGIGTELGAVGGGLAGGAAGGAAGAAGGAGLGALTALLSKNYRSELGRLALGGAFMGGNVGAGLGGLAGLYHGGRAGYNAAGKFMGPASYAKQSADKRASLPEGVFAGMGGAMSGGTAGLGVGALYGLLSGALQARKGKKLRGAAMGALRGAGGGGLIGAGIGGGLGLGTGLMMPNVLTANPITQAANAVSIASNPISHAAKMTLGAAAGGIGGGYLGNKARKSLIGDKPESEDEDEGLETEDKTEMDPALKAAGLVPSFQQAAREGLAGMRGRFKILENMRGVRDRLLSGDLYPMPPLDKHLNIVNRGSNHAADIGAKLERMMKQMRVPTDKIKDTVGNAALARSGIPPMKMPPEQLRDLRIEALGR